MSDTPRTDNQLEHVDNLHNEWICRGRNSKAQELFVPAEFARQLERELNQLEQRLAARRESIGTHSENCHHWHFECALKRLDVARKERDAAIEKLNQLKNNE